MRVSELVLGPVSVPEQAQVLGLASALGQVFEGFEAQFFERLCVFRPDTVDDSQRSA